MQGDTTNGKSLDSTRMNSMDGSSSSRGSAEASSVADDIEGYEQSKVEPLGVPLQPVRTSLFSPRMKGTRKKILIKFVLVNLLLGAFILSLLTVYWGATYRTTKHLRRVTVVAVLEDDPVDSPISEGMTDALPGLIDANPLGWKIFNTSHFMAKYNLDNRSEISERLIKLVYDEKYWFAFHLKPNMTFSLYNSLVNAGPDTVRFNSTEFVDVVYETGRDPASVASVMIPYVKELQSQWKNYYQSTYLPSFLSNITNTNDFQARPQMWSTLGDITFNFIDYRPFYDRIILSPLQVGMIYCIILTVFQFAVFGPLHMEMARVLKPKHIFIYRLFMSWSTYFFMSLFFCTVSAMMQIDFTRAFGRGGFVVYWFSTLLVMAAVGGANENVIGLIVVYGPQYLTSWLLTWIIMNIASSFYPLVLNNVFYRYGYMMPLHNGVDIFKVIFLNVSKQHMGRNYGILVAWIAVNTILAPVVMKFIGKKAQQNGKLQDQAVLKKYNLLQDSS
ncbi:Sng1p KNAG_0G00830 [Huiozyma naganishii CBS 8797]|uniref:DUF3533 domain-containing protein n=1 Tax=Huiozyma naganishii (strain ATCC MYA-139 / BCRC 22969 / CBS 8797 / KCTC 17520 / NBRC 10181 / NCYC 3082 / Yp74L-3) TaxID=1071383 RepID=J7S7S1_HUIN7|nr:hypothetical protein KNAG_0G00830 [Kazachstania naganishii CBS 8797]CCK71139.1 hypothetical protein KNAG_0G00830 [Kazachstania naganishii CBS 8797]